MLLTSFHINLMCVSDIDGIFGEDRSLSGETLMNCSCGSTVSLKPDPLTPARQTKSDFFR